MQNVQLLMDKNLTVYPIPTGNELNVFATESIMEVRIRDMQGGIVQQHVLSGVKRGVIDIKGLPLDTYIVEAVFENNKTGRSVFVKM